MNTVTERVADLEGCFKNIGTICRTADLSSLPLLGLWVRDIEVATERVVKELGKAAKAGRLKVANPSARRPSPICARRE